MKVSIIAASDNNNHKLAKRFEEEMSSIGAEVNFIDLTSIDLPVYTNKAEKAGIPEVMISVVSELLSSDGMMFFAPEYNGGLPPVLVNYIAWISRAGGEDFRKVFNGKPAVIGTHSGSGGLHALMALRMQLSYIGMNVLGRQAHTHYSKELKEESLKDICSRFKEILS